MTVRPAGCSLISAPCRRPPAESVMWPAMEPGSLCASALLAGKTIHNKINTERPIPFLANLDFMDPPHFCSPKKPRLETIPETSVLILELFNDSIDLSGRMETSHDAT